MNRKKPLSILGLIIALVLTFLGFNVELESINIPQLNNSKQEEHLNTDSTTIEDNLYTDSVNNDKTSSSISNTETQDEIILSKDVIQYEFRNDDLLHSHYEKHKDEFDNISLDEYLDGAIRLFNKISDSILSKEEKDGDILFFDTSTGEFGVLSTDGYIRTYFIPADGIDYYNRK